MEKRMKRLVELMPTLKNYSIVLLAYLIAVDPEGKGVPCKYWFLVERTGLCQRSLQFAIKELESKGLLQREGRTNAIFKALV